MVKVNLELGVHTTRRLPKSSQYMSTMNYTLKFISLFCGLILLPALAHAQTAPRAPSDMDPTATHERPITEMEAEIKAKQAIKYAEKGHQENVDRAKEIAQIGKELKSAVKDTPILSAESQKKIERLEKLTRKIRGEAGGDDQDIEIPNRPSDLPSTVSRIADAADTLSKEVQNTPRQVVSTCVIENANVLLELIKLMRTLSR